MKIRNILKTFGIVCMLFVLAAMPTISAFAAGAHAPGVQEPARPNSRLSMPSSSA